MKLHTFVICAYKESPYLEECITSVISQKDYSEIILATSTPNDHIKNLCKRYSLPMHVNTGVAGITQDWEYAIKQAQTPIVTIAHQDDVYFEDYSRRVVEEYLKHDRPIIFFTDYYEIRNGIYVQNNGLLRIKRALLMPLRIRSFQSVIWIRRRILSLGSAICCPSVAYVPENLVKPVFYNHFRTNEDWEAWERFSRLKGDFVYIHKPLIAHRIHPDSATSVMIEGGGRSREDYEMYRKFWPGLIAGLLTKNYKISEKFNKLV
ncbi:MAG: glycosyltransferase [Lachnospiraceae bacterium]|nr:glycosyltransferase [Lachnospiraceae bacterium]